MSINLKFKDQKKLIELYKTRPTEWLQWVKDQWSLNDNITLGEIIRNQLSGRSGNKGLNRKSGQASRALNVKTEIIGKNVISTLFIPESNHAKVYLPTHDKSRKFDGIIRAKNKKYLHFKTDDGSWVKTKSVRIPVRTDILGYYLKNGKKRRMQALNESIKILRKT